MEVKELMTRQIEVIAAEATIREAAEKMRRLDVGALPVLDHDQLVGMITDRDITIRAVAFGQDPSTTPVRNVMTSGVIYCFEDQDIEEVARVMEDNRIRRVLVLNRDKQPVGIVSLGDIATHAREQLSGEILAKVSEPAHVAR